LRKNSPDLRLRKRRYKASGKKILVTAAALGIVSGCAVFAWVQGVNGKVNSLVSAQTLFANTSTPSAQSTEEKTQKPVVAAMPRPPTRRRTARQIVSERTDPEERADRLKETGTSNDANPPAPVTVADDGKSTNEALAAAVIPSAPTSVARAPAPAAPPVSSFVLSKLIESPRPAYPPAARNAGVWGEVDLQAIIATDGKLRDIRVIRGHPLLNAAAIKAAEQQRYTPYMLNGVPQEVPTSVRFVFKP
jgi:protein TonB